MREIDRETRILLLFMALAVMISICCAVYYRRQLSGIIMDTAETGFERHYAFIAEDDRESFYRAIYESASKEAALRGDYLENMGSSLAQSYDRFDLLELSIDAGVDGIIVEAGESDDMKTLIDRAQSEGIPVITVGSDSPSSARKSYVGFGYYDLGTNYGKELLRHNAEKPSRVLVLMSSDLEGTGQNMIFQGILETLEENGSSGDFQLETMAVTDSSEFEAQERIGSFIMREEKLPEIMICLNEIYTTCVCQALVDYNRVGQTTVYGFYENDTILSSIQKDIIYATVTMDTEQMGRYCIEALKEYEEFGNVNEYLPADIRVITVDTIDAYLKEKDKEDADD